MANTDDVQGYRRKYENQMDLLEEADIDDTDREQIRKFVVHCRTNDSDIDSLGTVVGHLNRLRLSSGRSHMPLTEVEDIEDVNALKLHLQDVHGLSDGTIRNYMKAARKFFLWRDEAWAEDISVGSPPDRKHDPDEEIDPDELSDLLDAAPNPRDRALIALLADTGLRIGAILSFQVKHVNFETKRGTLTINDEANVKGADGPKPVTWSRAHISNWLDAHPRPDVGEAALIHMLPGQWTGDDDGALTQQYAGGRVKDIAASAGLDRDRVHAHLFRATAVSTWIRDDSLTDQKIKHRADWTEDSRQLGTYSRVTDEEMNDVIFEDYDIGDPDNGAETGHQIDNCYICDLPLRGMEDFCPSCAAPVSSTATEGMDDFEQRVRDFMVSEDDADGRELAAKSADLAEEDPDFAAALIEELERRR